MSWSLKRMPTNWTVRARLGTQWTCTGWQGWCKLTMTGDKRETQAMYPLGPISLIGTARHQKKKKKGKSTCEKRGQTSERDTRNLGTITVALWRTSRIVCGYWSAEQAMNQDAASFRCFRCLAPHPDEVSYFRGRAGRVRMEWWPHLSVACGTARSAGGIASRLATRTCYGTERCCGAGQGPNSPVTMGTPSDPRYRHGGHSPIATRF